MKRNSQQCLLMTDLWISWKNCTWIFALKIVCFLAHLSRRLTGELIGYPWIRHPSSSSVRRPSVHIFKRLLLNRLANQSQILCGASLGRGNESLYKWSRSYDQDGRHAHIYGKNLQKSSSPELAGRFPRNLVCNIRDLCPS